MHLPEKNYFINIHSHSPARIANEFTLQNINAAEMDKVDLDEKLTFSVGFHPWNVENSTMLDNELQKVEEAAKLNNVLAIGEIGLDKNYFENYSLQEEVFRHQIDIAEKASKPVIIHCVRAYPDMLKIKKELKTSVPWIIHGYNFNIITAENFIKEGCYLSFGNGLFLPGTKVHYIFARIDKSKFFLETDEGDHSIIQIYNKACELQNIELDRMREQIAMNFKTCFNQ